MEYVLIVILNFYRDPTIVHDFSTQAKCEYAKIQIQQTQPHIQTIMCVPK